MNHLCSHYFESSLLCLYFKQHQCDYLLLNVVSWLWVNSHPDTHSLSPFQGDCEWHRADPDILPQRTYLQYPCYQNLKVMNKFCTWFCTIALTQRKNNQILWMNMLSSIFMINQCKCTRKINARDTMPNCQKLWILLVDFRYLDTQGNSWKQFHCSRNFRLG